MKRKVSLKALDYQKVEEASGATARQVVKLVAGISKEKATELNKHIKGLSLKGVQSQVQGEQLRVTGKKRDDLQAVIAALKDHDFGDPAAVHQLPGLTASRRTRSAELLDRAGQTQAGAESWPIRRSARAGAGDRRGGVAPAAGSISRCAARRRISRASGPRTARSGLGARARRAERRPAAAADAIRATQRS